MSDLDKEELEATRKMQSSAEIADKMFEELGYKKIYEDDLFTQYRNECLYIEIAQTEMSLHKTTSYHTVIINKKLYKAINKKCKELGWLDE